MYLDGSLIEKTKSHKHLGFILDENLNFKDHVLNLSKKIQKQLNPLKYLSKTVKSYHLNAIYQGFIRPHFDYGDILYSANKTVLEQLERIHYRAGIIVSGCIHGSSTKKVLKILNWKSLADRRTERSQIYVTSGLVPDYVSNIFNKYKRTRDRNEILRETRHYVIPAICSQKFRKSPVIQLVGLVGLAYTRTPVHYRPTHSLKPRLNLVIYQEY